MRKEELQHIIEGAMQEKDSYVGVAIETQGMEGTEYIINPKCNLTQKLRYYDRAYNDDLTLKANGGIRIKAAAAGRTIAGVTMHLRDKIKNTVTAQEASTGGQKA
nr:MAG TPA: hypothetical protein [Caudoviricetes sp.]